MWDLMFREHNPHRQFSLFSFRRTTCHVFSTSAHIYKHANKALRLSQALACTKAASQHSVHFAFLNCSEKFLRNGRHLIKPWRESHEGGREGEGLHSHRHTNPGPMSPLIRSAFMKYIHIRLYHLTYFFFTRLNTWSDSMHYQEKYTYLYTQYLT